MRFSTACSLSFLVILSLTPTQGQDVTEVLNSVLPTVLQAAALAGPLLEHPEVQSVVTNVINPIVENREQIQQVALGVAQTALVTASAVAETLLQAIADAQQDPPATVPPATEPPATEPPFPSGGY